MENDPSAHFASDVRAATNIHLDANWKYEHRRMMQEVAPSLFLGPYPVSKDLESLQSNNISDIYILKSRQEVALVPKFPGRFEYHEFQLRETDSMASIHSLTQSLLMNTAAGRRCLCVDLSGIYSVSAAAVAYIMAATGCPFQLAYNYLHQKRGCAHLTPELSQLVRNYEPMAIALFQSHNWNEVESYACRRRRPETNEEITTALNKRSRR